MNVDYEEIATLAQKYIAKRPVVVLGCGVSIPYGLPSMSGLAEALLDRIEIDDDVWRQFKNILEETKDLEKSLHEVELSQSLLERVVEETWKITAEKDIEVYNRLIGDPTALDISRLFKYLLRTANPLISVVTTNYDRLAEYAANIAEAEVFTGFSSGWIQRFIGDVSKSSYPHRTVGYQGKVQILKVHGSLDWFRTPSQEPIAIPLSENVPQNCQPLIVTPGVSKYREVHKDPFRTVMSQADDVLKNASCYLCMGFGFNDEHVQPNLVNRVYRDNIPIVIVTKNLTNASREAFLNRPPSKFLIIEEDGGGEGSIAYYPDKPDGEHLKDLQLWDLPKFLDLLLGKDGGNK